MKMGRAERSGSGRRSMQAIGGIFVAVIVATRFASRHSNTGKSARTPTSLGLHRGSAELPAATGEPDHAGRQWRRAGHVAGATAFLLLLAAGLMWCYQVYSKTETVPRAPGDAGEVRLYFDRPGID